MRMTSIGDNCVDHYVDEDLAFPGGSCANAAVFASRLGTSAGYIGIVGRDSAGAHLAAALRDEGVDVSQLMWVDEPTSTTTVRLDGHGNRVFTNYQPVRTPLRLDREKLEFAAGSAWIHTGHASATEHLLPALRNIAAVTFDFSHRDLRYATPLLPQVTFATFSRESADDAECRELLARAKAAGPLMVVVTRGPRGALVMNDDVIVDLPAEDFVPVDTIGAGDAFFTSLTVSLMSRLPLIDALATANRFAAAACRQRGAFGHVFSLDGEEKA